MAPLDIVRARLHALRVLVNQARIDRELAGVAPTMAERDLQALLHDQQRTLGSLHRTAMRLPPRSAVRCAAERAFDAGSTCLAADPESELYALSAHEYELALADLRGALRARRFS